MAKNINNTKEKKLSFSSNLLTKLHLEDDLSINREPIDRGMFSYWWTTLRGNMTSMFTQNLMFLLFILPLFILLKFLMPTLEQKFILENAFNFVGDLGLGFTGATNHTYLATKGIYMFRILFSLLIIPCFTLAGLAASGLFYSMRNLVWGAKVKVRVHFFRGIKKYWWKFMLAFTLIGVVAYGVIGSIYGYLYLSAGGEVAPWWIWPIMIFACLLALVTILYMLVYLPTVTMYRMKHTEIMHNSAILSFVCAIPAIILAVLLAAPLLMALSPIAEVILLVFLGLYGFSFYALAIQCFGQYTADNFTAVLYEQKIMNEERERRRQNRGSKKKNNNNKKGKRK